MPEGIFVSVYAVSSEDPNHPASNLLKIQHGKKWKTRGVGEKSAYVILQFDQSQKITGFDIGNEHSAFVEILVGKIACSQDEFKEILITCSFMTPPESKNSTNPNRVRCFSKDQLVKSVAEEKWDLIKVVCTQPFNRHVQYGLGFIKMHVASNKSTNSMETKEKKKSLVPQQFLQKAIPSSSQSSSQESSLLADNKFKLFGSFKLREDSPDSESENNTLFNRWKLSTKISTAAVIRDASTPSSLKNHLDSLKPQKVIQTPKSEPSKKTGKELIPDRNRNDILYDKEDEIPNVKLEQKILLDQERVRKENESKLGDGKNKRKSETEKKDEIRFTKFQNKDKSSDKKKIVEEKIRPQDKNLTEQKPSKIVTDNNSSSHKKRPSATEESSRTKKTKTEKSPVFKTFYELLQGVTLVISGIQNPDRAELRQKALEMGAKYKANWDNSCTHLICAFKNTPKYNQVKGHGKIITRNWIENCYKLKKRLPWRRYAIDDDEQEELESEAEIYDISLKPKTEIIDNSKSNDNGKTTSLPESKIDSHGSLMKLNSSSHLGSKRNPVIKVCSDEYDAENELEHLISMQHFQCSKNNSPKQLHNNSANKSQDNGISHPISIYDVSTEEEENTKASKTESNSKFFENFKFFIGSVGVIEEIKLKNFIKQYGGEIVDTILESNYTITKEPIQGSSKFKGEMVTPLWIYECHDMECLIPTNRYRL